MRGDEDLIARPGPRRELFRQPVSLLPGDFFFRGKRLDIVVKPDRAILAVRVAMNSWAARRGVQFSPLANG